MTVSELFGLKTEKKAEEKEENKSEKVEEIKEPVKQYQQPNKCKIVKLVFEKNN